MLYNIPYKTKQFFFVLIKLSIVVGAFYFIYSKLTENGQLQLSDFIAFLKENKTFSTKNIIFLVILSGFNWFFEILKWKTLVKTIKSISFRAKPWRLNSITNYTKPNWRLWCQSCLLYQNL